jgi:tol-pal system-associated acyl-CoA thioesterase
MASPHSIQLRVYYQDTDAGGVVFHGQYFAFMERARTEMLNALGYDLARFAESHGILFMVHSLAATFHAPARLNEIVSVSAEVARMRRASLEFRQRVERGRELLVEAEVTLALVDRARLKPTRMPQELRNALDPS